MSLHIERVSMAVRAKTDASTEHVFLSPDWVRVVARTLQSACKANPYLKNLVSRFNLNLVYVVRKLPAELKRSYGNDQAVFLARVHKGTVAGVEVAAEMPSQPYHLLVTSDYKVARSLFLGQSSPVASFMMRRLSVQPQDGFIEWWPKHVPKAIVTANMVLKVMRAVPTEFESGS